MYPNHGYSLLELIITLTLISLCAILTYPNLHHFYQQTQSTLHAEHLLQAFAIARREAILRDVPVTLCGTLDHETCSSDWNAGGMIFVDKQRMATVARAEDLLFVLERAPAGGVLHWRSSLRRDYLTYYPAGTDRGETGALWFCEGGEVTATWAVIINQVGRARYETNEQLLKRYACDEVAA